MTEVDDTQASGTRRLSGSVLTIEIVLLLLAAVAFALLADVRLNSGDTDVTISETFDNSNGAAILLGVLGFCLLLGFILLFLRPGQVKVATEPAPAPEPAQEFEFESKPAPQVAPATLEPQGDVMDRSLGCRGCGIVFQHIGRVGDAFSCPNCSRSGVIAGHEPILADLHDEACPHCGTTFQRYMNHAECPSCHRALDI